MIYGSPILESTQCDTNSSFIFDMFQQNMNLYDDILENYKYGIFCSECEVLKEELQEQTKKNVNRIVTFLKKMVSNFIKVFINVVRGVISIYASILSFIPKVGQYAQAVSMKIPALKNINLVDKIPKSLMGNISQYKSKSTEELKKIIDGEDEDVKKYAQDYETKIINDACSGSLPKGEDGNVLLNCQYLIDIKKYPIITIGEIIAILKKDINMYQNKIKKLEKQVECLTNDWNSDLSKIESFINTEGDDANQVHDYYMLQLIKIEYASLFSAGGKMAKLQVLAYQSIGTRLQQTLTYFQEGIKNNKFTAKEMKKENERRNGGR